MLLRMALFFLNYPVRISQKSCRATVYGIDCYRRDRKDAPPVAQYRDVSIDRGEMDRLADRCNRGQLDPLQLEDVILDAIL